MDRPEAANGDILYKKVFLKISYNSQENTCTRVFFLIKLQASGLRCFPENFAKFLRAPILKNICKRLILTQVGMGDKSDKIIKSDS